MADTGAVSPSRRSGRQYCHYIIMQSFRFHRLTFLWTYLSRINCLRVGVSVGLTNERGSVASYIARLTAFPLFATDDICSAVHWSRDRDLTLDTCTPIDRWMPAQFTHRNTPMFQLAQDGTMGSLLHRRGKDQPLFSLLGDAQSAQCLFSGRLAITRTLS